MHDLRIGQPSHSIVAYSQVSCTTIGVEGGHIRLGLGSEVGDMLTMLSRPIKRKGERIHLSLTVHGL